MFNTKKDAVLVQEYNKISKELEEYSNLKPLIRAKTELTLKLLNSSSFKQGLYFWGVSKPKELLAIYLSCKSDNDFILTYGSTILNGVYLDFCQSFLQIANSSLKKYTIKDINTSQEIVVPISDIAEYYSSVDISGYSMNIDISTELEQISFELTTNEYMKYNDVIRHGFIKVDPLVKHTLIPLIESLFEIEDSANSRSYTPNIDNVVSLFKQEDRICN